MPYFTVPNSNGEPLVEMNTCHAPGGTAVGGQFSAKGSAGCAPGAPGTATTESELLSGSVSADGGPLEGGTNVTIIVEVTQADGSVVKAVYKPEIGEVWRSSFMNGSINTDLNNKDFSLAEREAAAYDVDQLLGLDVVPETVLREQVEVDVDMDAEVEDDGGGYDEDYAREQYDKYREDAQENAYEIASEQMQQKYVEDQEEYVKDVLNRENEIIEIWNQVAEDHPDDGPDYGTETIDQNNLPLGKEGLGEFEVIRRRDKVLDPMDLITEGQIDVSAPLNQEERATIRALVTKAIVNDGYAQLGDIDEDAVRRDGFKEYGDWLEDHADTEMRAVDEAIDSFSRWKQNNNIDSGGAQYGGRTRDRNEEAPHPNGGSIQRFVNSDYSYLSDDAKFRVAVLDYAVGAMDRHNGNLMVEDSKAHAIDNGYSFPDKKTSTLRSGVSTTMVFGKEMPEPLRKSVLARLTSTNWDTFIKSHPSMSPAEAAAFLYRIDNLKRALKTPEGLAELWRATRTVR